MNINQELFQFIKQSPTSFHAVQTIACQLEEAGYQQLKETDTWSLNKGGRYYVQRSLSSLIAFRIPEASPVGFMIAASHSDSPTLKIKPDAEITGSGFVRINTEPYGGLIASSWIDRPLTAAGRVCVRTPSGIASKLICIDRDLFVIPSLAIHMDRSVNEGHAVNFQKEMLPLYRAEGSGTPFSELIAEEAGVKPEDVLSCDLYLVQRAEGFVFGADDCFICSPRLDDLQCGFADLHGFLKAKASDAIPVFAIFDNEEVGSLTKQGAAGTFLSNVLERINESLGISRAAGLRMFADSFVVSADNAHSIHPNYPEKADPAVQPHLNKGIVIKYAARQSYTSDAESAGLFQEICRRADVPVQEFVNHSNSRGGSTLGSLLNTHISMRCVDIGLPQLAMHSGFETAGAADTQYLIDAMTFFFEHSLQCDDNGTIDIR